MSIHKLAKSAFRTMVPKSWQDALWANRDKPINRALINLKTSIEKTGKHDDIYDEKYFTDVDGETAQSAAKMADSICRDLSPATVIDVGCGTGVLLDALRQRGVSGRGLEYATAALEFCKKRQLDVTRFDLEKEPPPDWRSDVSISMEVAEHLPERCADRFVNLLSSVADRVVMTAATPGQGGTDHVNEQPREYWIQKFLSKGMRYDDDMTMKWRNEWKPLGVADCFCENLMVFTRAAAQ